MEPQSTSFVLSSMNDQIRPSEPAPVWWLAVTFGTFWAGLLAHEGAHFGTLHITGLRSPMGSAVVPAAGPVMTLAIIAGCAVLVARSQRAAIKRIAFVTAAAAASRLVLTAIPTMLGGSNDEHSVMLATGWPAGMIWTVEAALTVLLLVWIVRRSGLQVRPWQGGMMLLGIFAGWTSALTFGRAIGLPI